jgi:hypothetical protein
VAAFDLAIDLSPGGYADGRFQDHGDAR